MSLFSFKIKRVFNIFYYRRFYQLYCIQMKNKIFISSKVLQKIYKPRKRGTWFTDIKS